MYAIGQAAQASMYTHANAAMRCGYPGNMGMGMFGSPYTMNMPGLGGYGYLGGYPSTMRHANPYMLQMGMGMSHPMSIGMYGGMAMSPMMGGMRTMY